MRDLSQHRIFLASLVSRSLGSEDFISPSLQDYQVHFIDPGSSTQTKVDRNPRSNLVYPRPILACWHDDPRSPIPFLDPGDPVRWQLWYEDTIDNMFPQLILT
jgi:hypothetical protein